MRLKKSAPQFRWYERPSMVWDCGSLVRDGDECILQQRVGSKWVDVPTVRSQQCASE